MARRRLPQYVHAFEDRHGKARHYFRRGSFRAALPGLPWSTAFMTAHAEALEGSKLHAEAKPAKAAVVAKNGRPAKSTAKPGSFSALIAEYRKSSNFTSLAPSTGTTYGRLLDRLESNHGKLPVASLNVGHVERLIEIRASLGGPEAGNNLRRILKAVMKFAVKRSYRLDDPTIGVEKVKRPKGAKKGFRTWTESDIALFSAKYPIGTREYLALALLLCTGQRRSDVVKIGPANIIGSYDPTDFAGRRISLVQQKTGKSLVLPIAPMLAEALADAKIPTDAPAFLMTKYGGAFKPESFSNQFSEWARSAGINGQASPHGLRKAAARRLAEAGCSVKLIAAVTGHTTLKEIENYTTAADQEAMAELAIAQLQRPKDSHRSQ